MIEKYTPVTRDRKANHPNTSASSAGASTIMSSANGKWLKPYQNQGSDFQFRNTMKSGRTGSPYTPRGPICRIRYMPMA